MEVQSFVGLLHVPHLGAEALEIILESSLLAALGLGKKNLKNIYA